MKTVIFRPTNKCNLRCTYCYDKNNHNYEEDKIKKNATELFKSEEQDIINSLDKLYANEKNPRIIFHGGEPLLIKRSVLDNFLKIITKDRKLNINIQTNGTLIDEEIIELFKKYNFCVGLSLDGCNEIQNSSRIYPNGKNSLQTVLDKIKMLQNNDVKFGIIMSINKSHIGCENDLYNFIASNNLSCNIRPVFSSDKETAKQVMTTDEYVNFFNNMFDIWYNDDEKKVSTKQITEFYQKLREIIDPKFKDKTCNTSNRCFKDFISLDVMSNLYACNRLYGIDKFYYGNLKYDSMETIQEKIEMLLKEREKSINNKCGNCERLNKCNGGCPAESYDIYGDILHPAPECEINQKVLKYIGTKI